MGAREDKQTAWCHRCGEALAAAGQEAALYCGHCGAPQLTLPDYLRLVPPEMEALRARTTGMVPPPRPRMVDWRAVLRCAGVVGSVAAVLMALGLLVDSLSALGTLWMLASGLAAVWLYGRVRPQGRMDARVGVRVGVVSGLTTVSLVGTVLALGGLVERFVLHRSAAIDDWVNKGLAVFLAQVNSQPGAPVFGPQAVAILLSPEGRAGYILLNFAVDGLFVVALAAAGGALTGTLARRRSRMGRAL